MKHIESIHEKSLFSQEALLPIDLNKRLDLDSAVRKFVVEALQPLSIVNSPAFRGIFDALKIEYKPMSDVTLKEKLKYLHQFSKQNVNCFSCFFFKISFSF